MREAKTLPQHHTDGPAPHPGRTTTGGSMGGCREPGLRATSPDHTP